MTKRTRVERLLRDDLAQSQGQARRGARPVLWACMGVVFVFIVWACLARMDEVVRGEGKVVPHSRLQVIQSLEGGILAEMKVVEGDVVEAGQSLALLDDTRFAASALESQAQVTALMAAIARLETEVLGRDAIVFPDEVLNQRAVVQSERALFRARRQNLDASLKALMAETDLAIEQLALIQPLAARRVVSEVEVLRLQKEIATLTGRQAEVRNLYMQEAYTELANKKAELAAQTQILNQRQDQLQRTELLAPLRARVNAVRITTRGGVVQPGEAVMELTPLDDQLMVEVRILPKDVAFLREGMEARVKITAYDYTVYGDILGVVKQISEDTLVDDTARGPVSYYDVKVKMDQDNLNNNGIILPIKPGMIAEVDIKAGDRSVMSYLLKPILKAKLV